MFKNKNCFKFLNSIKKKIKIKNRREGLKKLDDFLFLIHYMVRISLLYGGK